MINRRLDKRSREERFRDDSEFFSRIERYLNKKKGNEYELGSSLGLSSFDEPPKNGRNWNIESLSDMIIEPKILPDLDR